MTIKLHHLGALSLSLLVIFSLSSCCSRVGKLPNGYTRVDAPSDIIKVGQIVAIYTQPRKIQQIANQDGIDDKLIKKGKSANLTSTEAATIETDLTININDLISSQLKVGYKNFVSIELSDTKINDVSLDIAARELRKYLSENPDSMILIKEKLSGGTKIDVITSVFVADLKIIIDDKTAFAAGVDIEKIKSIVAAKTKVGYESGSTLIVTGNQLVVGYQIDPSLIKLIVSGELNRIR